MNNIKSVSVIVPAYNESENVELLISSLKKTETEYPEISFEFIFVDDGSTDRTFELLTQRASELRKYKVLRNYFNEGLTSAIVKAGKNASYDYLFLFPADMQYASEIIPQFLEKVNEGFDAVTGKKIGKYEKKFISGVYNTLCRLFFNVKVSDINSVKIFHKDIIKNVTLHKDWHRYIIPIASLNNKRIAEIPVKLYPRQHGYSKFKNKSRILIGFLDLISVKIIYSFKDKPMLIFGTIGFISICSGIMAASYFTYSRLISHLPYEPSITFVALFILTGLLLFAIGFIAEIIIDKNNIYENS